MHFSNKRLASILLGLLFAVPFFVSGCAVRARVYDPYYHDYHAWGGEAGYYNRWEDNTHRDHRDFNKRSAADQRAYWEWRHHQDH